MARKSKKRIGLDPSVKMKAGGTPAPSHQSTDAVSHGGAESELKPTPEANEPNTPGESDSSSDKDTAQSQPSTADDRIPISDLGDALTIQNAEHLREKLEAILKSAEEVLWLNIAELESVDTAGLQLLGAFAQEARTRGITVKWRNPPEVLVQGVRRLDLEKILHLSPDMAHA